MNFSCNAKLLLKGVTLISGICHSKTTKAILQDIRLNVLNNYIELIGTDLEVAIRYKIYDSSIVVPGHVAIPAAKLLNILREISASDVEFSSEQRVCSIKTVDSNFKLISDDPDEFPLIPEYDFETAMIIDSVVFKCIANKTIFAVARDLSCYAYNGVLIELYENGIKFIATDGRRLAIAGNVDNSQTNVTSSAIVQIKGINQIIKNIEDGQKVLLKIINNQFIMKIDEIEIASRLLEGEFPKYREVIPQDNAFCIQVNKDNLYSALRKVSITAGTEVRSVQFIFTKNNLKLYSQQEGIGESECDVPIQYGGDKFEITFNPDFIADYLRVLDSGNVMFCLKDESSSCLLKNNESDFYIVMPIT